MMRLVNFGPVIQDVFPFLTLIESSPDTVREIETQSLARVLNCGERRDEMDSRIVHR